MSTVKGDSWPLLSLLFSHHLILLSLLIPFPLSSGGRGRLLLLYPLSQCFYKNALKPIDCLLVFPAASLDQELASMGTRPQHTFPKPLFSFGPGADRAAPSAPLLSSSMVSSGVLQCHVIANVVFIPFQSLQWQMWLSDEVEFAG